VAEHHQTRQGEPSSGDAQPVGYRYLYPHHDGTEVWRFETYGREINGSRPIRSEPVYAHPSPAISQPVTGEPSSGEALRLAQIFANASRQSTNIIDPPFDCVRVNLRPETWATAARLLAALAARDGDGSADSPRPARSDGGAEGPTEQLVQAAAMLWQQIEFYQGKRVRGWDGDFLKREYQAALSALAAPLRQARERAEGEAEPQQTPEANHG
jgi:hypothetical protein